MSPRSPLSFLGLVGIVFVVLMIVAGRSEKDAVGGGGRHSFDSDVAVEAGARRQRSRVENAISPAGPRDPVIDVQGDGVCPVRCSGTAFAIGDTGHWLTAHHVVGGCSKVGLQTSRRRATQVASVTSHPVADVAVLTLRRDVPGLLMEPGPVLDDQEAFHNGYPRGEPGDVYTRLLGRLRARSRRGTEPGLAWAEVKSHGTGGEALGGLSGSPVLNPEGRIIGVTIAASQRRGRVVTAAPVSLHETLLAAGLNENSLYSGSPASAVDAVLTPRNFARQGDRLRSDLTVAKVICIGGRRRRS